MSVLAGYKMKVFFAIMMAFILGLVGCGQRVRGNDMDWIIENTNNRKDMANRYAERIAEIIEQEDTESLVELFSTKAFDEIGQENLEEEAAELFRFFGGEVQSYEGNTSAHETNDYGEKTLEIDAIYIVTTDEGEYRMRFVFQPVNDTDESQIGLSRIVASTEEEYQQDDFKWLYLDGAAGVYVME